jgi:hypothetical protein
MYELSQLLERERGSTRAVARRRFAPHQLQHGHAIGRK